MDVDGVGDDVVELVDFEDKTLTIGGTTLESFGIFVSAPTVAVADKTGSTWIAVVTILGVGESACVVFTECLSLKFD